jgi:hypothetical protein
MTGERRIGKYFEERGHVLNKVLSRNLPGEVEEKP